MILSMLNPNDGAWTIEQHNKRHFIAPDAKIFIVYSCLLDLLTFTESNILWDNVMHIKKMLQQLQALLSLLFATNQVKLDIYT